MLSWSLRTVSHSARSFATGEAAVPTTSTSISSEAGILWQREPFDHIVRSEAQLKHFRKYIAENPQKGGLREGFVVGMGDEVRQRK